MDYKVLLLSFLFLSMGIQRTYAQTAILRVWGEVLDNETNKPIPGVSIKMLRSLTGARTDSTGEFYISLSYPTDTIIFSAIGYEEVCHPISEKIRLPFILRMKPVDNIITEVVVESGFQSIPKERATGSYAFIDSSLWSQRIGTSVVGRLEGLTNGLLVNKSNPDYPTVQIRGLSSFGVESMKPLIILDNFPYEGDLEALNPNDIESISILKDASAASIWGARAGNGVIVIKSKSATAGQDVLINFTSNQTISPRPDLFTANHLAVSEYVDMQKMLYENGFYTADFGMYNHPAIPLVAEYMEEKRLGKITDIDLENKLDQLKQQDYRYGMSKYLYRASYNQQNAVSMSGGTERLRFVLSGSYDNNTDHIVGNSYKRYNLRSSNNIKISEKIGMDVGLWMTIQNGTNNSPGGYGSFRGISGYDEIATVTGEPLSLDIYYRGIFTDTVGGSGLLDWKYRPLQELALANRNTHSKDVIFNWALDYQVINGLTAKVKFQKQFGDNTNLNIHHRDSYYTRDIINTFTEITDNGLKRNIPEGAIRESLQSSSSSYNLRAQLDFNRSFGDHQITSIMGSEVRDIRTESSSDMIYGFDEDKLTFINIDPTTEYPSYNNLFGYKYIPSGSNLNKYVNRYVSIYANGAYSFLNRYTITGSIRRDASNLFGVSTNQKWNPLWSIGGLWHIHKEEFFNINSVNKLSIRATYGFSGNIPSHATALTQLNYFNSLYSPIRERFATVYMGPNPSLQWETVRMFNVGLDFDLFANRRLTGSVEYYTKQSNGLFNSTKLDPIIGMSIQPKNSASIDGKGVDINISSALLQRSFKWNSMVLFSYSDFNVTKNLDPPSVKGLVSSGNSIFPVEGYNPYLIVSYRWAGLNPENGNPRGYLQGETSEDYYAIQSNNLEEQVVHGPSVPRFFGAWRNSLQWKSWNLTVGINYKAGHYFRKHALNYEDLFRYGQSNGNQEYANRWRNKGDESHTNVPSLIYPSDSQRDNFYKYSEINVQKADHIKLNEMRLQYQIQSKRKSFFRDISCYVFLDNMNVILWKANSFGIDPENLIGYSRPINYSLGIQLSL